MSSLDLVREFHVAMGAPVRSPAEMAMLDIDRKRLRLRLILEEVCELAVALGSDGLVVMEIDHAHDVVSRDTFSRPASLVDATDALGDIRYVTDGAAVEMGIPLDEATEEIHRSNMTKRGGKVREDGKIMKPDSYQPPNLARVLELAHARAIGQHAGSNGAPANVFATVEPTKPWPVYNVREAQQMRDSDRNSSCVFDTAPVATSTTHTVGGRVEVTVSIGNASGTRVGKVVALDQVAVDLGDGHARAYPPSAVRSLA